MLGARAAYPPKDISIENAFMFAYALSLGLDLERTLKLG